MPVMVTLTKINFLQFKIEKILPKVNYITRNIKWISYSVN